MVRNKPFKRCPFDAFRAGGGDNFWPMLVVYGVTCAHLAGSFIPATNRGGEAFDGSPSAHKVGHRFRRFE